MFLFTAGCLLPLLCIFNFISYFTFLSIQTKIPRLRKNSISALLPHSSQQLKKGDNYFSATVAYKVSTRDFNKKLFKHQYISDWLTIVTRKNGVKTWMMIIRNWAMAIQINPRIFQFRLEVWHLFLKFWVCSSQLLNGEIYMSIVPCQSPFL